MPREVTVIEFRGQNYPNRCSYCKSPIEKHAIIFLNTNLIFCNEDCITEFIRTRTADIYIREEEEPRCMLS